MRVILALALTIGAAPVWAETEIERKARCEVQAGIVHSSVKQRSAGAEAAAVKKNLSKGKNAVDKKYVPSVPYLVDWVYTVPENLLGKDVGNQFHKTCVETPQ